MRFGRIGVLVYAALCSGWACAAEPSLIPWPANVLATRGSFIVDGRTPICSGAQTAAVARRLRESLRAAQGLQLEIRACERDGIALVLVPATDARDDESYVLEVSDAGLRIESHGHAGLYYGAMTAVQLLSSVPARDGAVTLAGMHIEDQPRFRWRGLMLDSARHFLPVEDVKILIEQMGQHKLNVLHLHLTDDQGWRLEIRRYPELTAIGAWRTPPSNGGPGSPTKPYGGFYTQDEIRDLVRYAADRHITVVPEIDLPGHAQAAVAARAQLSVPGDRPSVSGDWGINPYLFNTDAKSLEFVERVLDEVMDLFPGKYIHLGGDEAIKDQWKASASVQAQMRALGIANEHEMQSWFMEQLGKYLAAHGRTMVGWDEILEGGLPPDATVMSWRGSRGAIDAARLGHDVVLSPAPTLYFDNLQSRRDDEPAGRMAITSLSQVYSFDAMPASLSPAERRHVLGAQANLWSEYLSSGWYVQHAAFPRVAALAETVWTPPSRLSWSGFLARLPLQMERYRRQGIGTSDAAFAVDFEIAGGSNVALRDGRATVILGNQTDFGEIHYSLDGSEPTRVSPTYSTPLVLELGARLRARTFSTEGLALAATRDFELSEETLRTRVSNQLHTCMGGDFGLRVPLTPDSPARAPVYDVDLFHSCYLFTRAPLDGVKAVRVDVARLARNYGLADEKRHVRQYPARTRFGELVIYQDRCETGVELARVPLADPATSSNLQTLQPPLAPADGARDLCLLFTASIDGPLYAIERVSLLTH